MICSIEGCGGRVKHHGFCNKHYKRWYRNGDPLKTKYNMAGGICVVESCGRPVMAKQLCSMHWKRNRNHGSPDVKLNTNNKGLKCAVLTCENEAFSKGYCQTHYKTVFKYGRENLIIAPRGSGTITKDGYKEIYVNGEKILEHIWIAERALGKKLPPGAVVHHMNEDKTDNFTPLNLIICPDQAYHMLLHKRMRDYEARQKDST